MKAKNLMEYAILNGNVDKDALNAMIKQLPEHVQQRFVEAIIGLVDSTEMNPNVPQVKTIYGRKNCRFKSYNYLFDRVDYEYDENDTRWFKDESYAKKFQENGNYSWLGEREQKEGYDFCASYVFKYTCDCSLSTWMEAE